MRNKRYVDPPKNKERVVIYNNYKEIGVVRISPRKWYVVACTVKDGLKSIRIHTRMSIGNDPNMPDFIDKYKKSLSIVINGPDGFTEENAGEKLLALLTQAVESIDLMEYEDDIIYASDYDKPLAKNWFKD